MKETRTASPPVFAVLFKTHFWDDFAERQFQRLRARAGAGDVFIVVDETNGAVEIPHDNVIRMTEELSESEGYLRQPPGKTFWYNTDYQLYHFFDRHEQYDYALICEYDCVLGVEADAIVGVMAAEGLHFVGERIQTPADSWGWVRFAKPHYPPETEISGRLVCCAVFSKPFARQLQEVRRAHTRAVQQAEQPFDGLWPNNEALVGTEIGRLSIAERPLSDFADTSAYDWAPPHLEAQLPLLPERSVIHPVLDPPRFMRKLSQMLWNPDDFLVKGSALHKHLSRCDPAYVANMFLDRYVAQGAWEMAARTRDFAIEQLGDAAPPPVNVARGRPATQSSTCIYSRHTLPHLDAAGAVNGVLTGSYSFHTGYDAEPWWCVDLEAVAPITAIHIHNRKDQPHRAKMMVVSGSKDMRTWETLYRHDPSVGPPGAGGGPLRLDFTHRVPLRFVRVHLATQECLHLDEIEILV